MMAVQKQCTDGSNTFDFGDISLLYGYIKLTVSIKKVDTEKYDGFSSWCDNDARGYLHRYVELSDLQ